MEGESSPHEAVCAIDRDFNTAACCTMVIGSHLARTPPQEHPTKVSIPLYMLNIEILCTPVHMYRCTLSHCSDRHSPLATEYVQKTWSWAVPCSLQEHRDMWWVAAGSQAIPGPLYGSALRNQLATPICRQIHLVPLSSVKLLQVTSVDHG